MIVSNESGKYKEESRISNRGQKRLKYVLYEVALSLVGRSSEFKAIYRTRKENLLKKRQLVVAIICKSTGSFMLY